MSYTELAKEWDHEKNGDLKPSDVTPGVARKVWWRCPVCYCSWKVSVNSRVIFKTGCPDCSKRNRIKDGVNNDIKTYCINNDIEYVLNEWDELHNTIMGVEPDKTSITTRRKVWWKCSVCGKTYNMRPSLRIEELALRGKTACPYCKNLSLKKAHFI